jgi:hypothetical protein
MTTVRAEYKNGMMSYNVEQSITSSKETRIKELEEIIRQSKQEMVELICTFDIETHNEIMLKYKDTNKEN